MHYLALNILCSVSFLVVFRLFPRYKIDNMQAIVMNYLVCTAIAFSISPKQLLAEELTFQAPWLPIALLLGLLFISIFYLVALTAQRVSLTVSSVASKMSMVIPVAVSIFILKTSLNFSLWNGLGILFAVVAVTFTSITKRDKSQRFQASGLERILLPLAVFLGSGLVDTLINVANRIYLTEENNIVLTVGIFGIASILGLVLLLISFFRGKQIALKNILAGIALGIPNYASIYFLLKALSFFQNDGATVYPISNIGVILLSTLLGILAFKEKLSPLNKAGVLLAVLAIGLLSWKA